MENIFIYRILHTFHTCESVQCSDRYWKQCCSYDVGENDVPPAFQHRSRSCVIDHNDRKSKWTPLRGESHLFSLAQQAPGSSFRCEKNGKRGTWEDRGPGSDDCVCAPWKGWISFKCEGLILKPVLLAMLVPLLPFHDKRTCLDEDLCITLRWTKTQRPYFNYKKLATLIFPNALILIHQTVMPY